MRTIDADAFIEMIKQKCDPQSVLDPLVLSICRGAIKSMSTVESMQWIPCGERLPEEYGNYLITEMPIGDFEIEPYVATYYPEDDEWTTGSPIKIVRRPVIAWMPLPEPYREIKE